MVGWPPRPPSPAWTSPRPSSGPRSASRPSSTGTGSPTGSWTCSGPWRTSPTASPSTSSSTAVQTATRAERAGADAEVVVAALCHDIGKAVSVPNHPEIAAAILKPYVRPEVHDMIRVHQDFQGRHYYAHFGGDPDARETAPGRARPRGLHPGRAVRRRVGPGRLRPRLRQRAPRALRAAGPRGLRPGEDALTPGRRELAPDCGARGPQSGARTALSSASPGRTRR